MTDDEKRRVVLARLEMLSAAGMRKGYVEERAARLERDVRLLGEHLEGRAERRALLAELRALRDSCLRTSANDKSMLERLEALGGESLPVRVCLMRRLHGAPWVEVSRRTFYCVSYLKRLEQSGLVEIYDRVPGLCDGVSERVMRAAMRTYADEEPGD